MTFNFSALHAGAVPQWAVQLPVNSEGRARFIRHTWPYLPDGPKLDPSDDPAGFRTPNGLAWAHAVSEFGNILRAFGWSAVFSRSQFKELGRGHYDDSDYLHFLVPPRVVRPWPLLKLPKGHPANTVPPMGAIDMGCWHEHDDPKTRTYTMAMVNFAWEVIIGILRVLQGESLDLGT